MLVAQPIRIHISILSSNREIDSECVREWEEAPASHTSRPTPNNKPYRKIVTPITSEEDDHHDYPTQLTSTVAVAPHSFVLGFGGAPGLRVIERDTARVLLALVGKRKDTFRTIGGTSASGGS